MDKNLGERRVLNSRGIARAVVLLAAIAVALVIAIAVPLAIRRAQDVAGDVDELYSQAAYDEAYLSWVQDGKSFSAIYDSENKTFVEISGDMRRVEPYGTLEEHEGMVLQVKVDEQGNIRTKWVYQDDETIYK